MPEDSERVEGVDAKVDRPGARRASRAPPCARGGQAAPRGTRRGVTIRAQDAAPRGPETHRPGTPKSSAVDPGLDVPRDEELLEPPRSRAPCARRPCARRAALHVDRRRVDAPACALEHLCEPHPEPARLARLVADGLDRAPVEAHRLRERQLACGLLRGLLGAPRRTLVLPCPEQVRRERLGVDTRHRHEHPRQAGVEGPERRRRDVRDDRLADAVVRHLDDLAPVTQPGADEPPRLQVRDGLVERPVDTCGIAHDRDGQGPRADGDDELDETTGDLRERRHPFRHDVVETDGARRARRAAPRLRARHPDRVERRARAARKLLDEEGTPARLAGDRLRGLARRRVRRVEEGSRERRGVARVERAEHEIANLGAHRPSLEYPGEERARGCVLLSVREADQDRRVERRPHQVEQQPGAVDVAPLRVADAEDERRLRRETRRGSPRRRQPPACA